MSRVGKHAVAVPSGVTLEVKGRNVSAKGKLGNLSLDVPEELDVKFEDNKVSVTPRTTTQHARALWGTTRRNLQNMVTGVSDGYKRSLEIEGVGFRAAMQGNTLVLQLGFSHEVRFDVPSDVKVVAEKPTLLHITGFDKQRVGQIAAEIRAFRKPEPYKGKGIRYSDEVVLRKEGKKK